MISVQFSMDASPLNEEERELFSRMGEWVIVNERNRRYLIDAVCDADIVPLALRALQSRKPVIIGAWRFDGSAVPGYPLNEGEWLNVAPDDLVADGERVLISRPTAFRDVHRWAGWGEKHG
jgi:hypothetical protein